MTTRGMRWGVLLVSIAMVWVSSCGGDDSQAGASSCHAAATHLCETLQQCIPGDFALTYPSLERCVLQYQATCEQPAINPGSRTTEERMAACYDAVAPSCEVLLGGHRGLPLPAACEPVAGEREDGEVCAFETQCKSTSCSAVQGFNCGTCRPLVEGKEGESCADSGRCEGLLLCNSHRVCARAMTAGEPCSYIEDCQSPLVCTDTKVCQERVVRAEGEPCTKEAQCDTTKSLRCAPGGTCVRIEIAGPGEACGSASGCAGGLHCGGGKCLRGLDDGEACDESASDCTAPATCIIGRCLLPGRLQCL